MDEIMKTMTLIFAAFAFAGCKGKAEQYSPQEVLDFHSCQPEQQSANLIEDALKNGAKIDQPNSNGQLPWFAAAKGVDENRVYAGSSKSPDELKLTEGNNNPAESNSDSFQNSAIAALKVLINHGADKNAKNSLGENALHLASIQGRERVADFLVSIGLEVNVQDSAGYTPLMRAISSKSPRTVEILLSHGARIDLMSKYGQNAEMLAQESGDASIAELITKTKDAK
jgi:hypothetical protein